MFKKKKQKISKLPKEISTDISTLDDEVSMLHEENAADRLKAARGKIASKFKKTAFGGRAAQLLEQLHHAHGNSEKDGDEALDFMALLNKIEAADGAFDFDSSDDGPTLDSLLDDIEEYEYVNSVSTKNVLDTSTRSKPEESAETIIIKEKIENTVSHLSEEHEELKEHGVEFEDIFISEAFKHLAEDMDCECEGVAIGIDDDGAIIPLQALVRGHKARVIANHRRELIRQDKAKTCDCFDSAASYISSFFGQLFSRAEPVVSSNDKNENKHGKGEDKRTLKKSEDNKTKKDRRSRRGGRQRAGNSGDKKDKQNEKKKRYQGRSNKRPRRGKAF